MSDWPPLSRKWNTRTHSYFQRIIAASVPKNQQRVATITRGLTMPEVQAVPIGSGRRMTAAILFFDLEEFTHTTSQLPNEYTLYILNTIIPTVTKILARWQGVVEKNTGDGVMAILGTETRDEKLIARDAIEAALVISYVMSNDIQPLLAEQGLPALDFRIGVDMGDILLARIGVVNDSFITAVGSAANRASKLQGLAESNGISIGSNLYNNINPIFDSHCTRGTHPDWNWVVSDRDPSEYPYYHLRATWPPFKIS